MERIQGSPKVASMSEEVEVQVSPKGCAPLSTYRVEKTKGLIDESDETVGLQGVAMLMVIMEQSRP